MPFESIGNRRLYHQIARQIIGLIEAGEYKPGERLPAERVLAERLAVSRPTLRDALLALEVENRVEIRGGSGVFVASRPATTMPSPVAADDVRAPEPFERFFARSLIEPDIAALAAKNASPKHLAALAKALGDMVCCSAGDSRRLDYDREFHFALAEACGNTALFLALKALWPSCQHPVDPDPEEPPYPEQYWRRVIIEHREILEAVKRGDARAARLSMQRHLKKMHTRYASGRGKSRRSVPKREPSSHSGKIGRQAGALTATVEFDKWDTRPARPA